MFRHLEGASVEQALRLSHALAEMGAPASAVLSITV